MSDSLGIRTSSNARRTDKRMERRAVKQAFFYAVDLGDFGYKYFLCQVLSDCRSDGVERQLRTGLIGSTVEL
jgi:hypothetical protein